MAVTVERLIATLEARIDKYEKNLQKAYGQTDRQFNRIERRGKQMEARLRNVGAGFGTTFTKALAVAGGARAFQSLLDSATRIDNALKVVGLSGAELEKVYGQLRDSAVRNAAPLETLVELYSRAAMAATNLGATQEDLVKFTDNVAVALRVSGKSATESAGALLQLSQLMSGSVVQAQEYNSLIDGAYPLLQAVAAGLKETGGDVGKLTQLVKAGKVPTRAFFEAFQTGSNILRDKVAGAALTTSQSFENVRTAAIDAMRDFGRGSSGAKTLADAIQSLADVVNSVDFTKFGQEVAQLVEWLNQVKGALDWLHNAGANFGAATGLDRVGEFLTGGAVQRQFGPVTVTSSRALQSRIDGAFEQTVQSAGDLTVNALKNWADRNGLSSPAAGGKTERLPSSVVNPVSLADYDLPSAKKKGRGGGSRLNDYQREVRQIQERTAAIQSETAAMAGINPLIEDYGYALEKARAKQDLLTAAKRAGIAITPELEANIEKLAEGYAQAGAEAERLAESQDRARQTAEELRDLGKDVMGGFIKDMVDGKSAADALASALGKIGDKLLDMALTSMFSKGGIFGAGGGLLGGLLIPGVLHDGGVAGRDGYGHGRAVSPAAFAGARRYHRGGIAGLQPGEVPAILQRGEVVLPKGVGGGAASGGKSMVQVVLSPDLEARILQQAAGQSVQIVQASKAGMVKSATDAVQQRVIRQPAYLRT